MEQQQQHDADIGPIVYGRVGTREPAQGLVEYGLAVGVVGVLAIAALQRWGTDISNLFDRMGAFIRPIGS